MIVTHKDEAGPWKRAALLFALGCLAAVWWGHSQWRRSEALERDVAAAKAEVAEAREATKQAEKRELPVTLSYSMASPEVGRVAVLKSDFPRSLELVAMCSTPRTGQRKRYNLVIPARGEVEIGREDGWSVVAGSRIVLYNAAFRPAEYVVPDS